ncbi:uncharacterized protein LOC135464946 [Liolophura sinensis]|uniref:uncharacterized protein LOC135464946 n=1 Tax=Liolophura sinensis TaxID=3198878 RepID=UPI0031592633
MKDGNVDGVPENADNEAYLGALKCRIWLSVCNLETNPDNGNPWRQIKRQLWSLKRLIWKSDRVNIAGGRRNWARWWLATYRDTRAAAKADLAGKCAEWREKCNAEDGDPTDPGPDDGDSEEEMSDEVTDNTSPTVPTSPSALTDVNVDRLHEE